MNFEIKSLVFTHVRETPMLVAGVGFQLWPCDSAQVPEQGFVWRVVQSIPGNIRHFSQEPIGTIQRKQHVIRYGMGRVYENWEKCLENAEFLEKLGRSATSPPRMHWVPQYSEGIHDVEKP